MVGRHLDDFGPPLRQRFSQQFAPAIATENYHLASGQSGGGKFGQFKHGLTVKTFARDDDMLETGRVQHLRAARSDGRDRQLRRPATVSQYARERVLYGIRTDKKRQRKIIQSE